MEGAKGKVGGSGKGGEMTQTLYAHMNKRKKNLMKMQQKSTIRGKHEDTTQ
jgi:hypothetical protein